MTLPEKLTEHEAQRIEEEGFGEYRGYGGDEKCFLHIDNKLYVHHEFIKEYAYLEEI